MHFNQLLEELHLMKIEELDVIRTKDGREGTVVHVFDMGDLSRAY